MYFTTITLTVMVLGHFFYKPYGGDLAWEQSPFCFWKWASWLFQFNFFLDLIITIFFWCYLIPFSTFEEECQSTYNLDHLRMCAFNLCLNHTMPFLWLFIDWFLNGIFFEWTHMVPNSLFLLLYVLSNLWYVKSSGQIVYSHITWDSAGSWFIAIGFFVLFILIQTVTISCSRKKVRRLIRVN